MHLRPVVTSTVPKSKQHAGWHQAQEWQGIACCELGNVLCNGIPLVGKTHTKISNPVRQSEHMLRSILSGSPWNGCAGLRNSDLSAGSSTKAGSIRLACDCGVSIAHSCARTICLCVCVPFFTRTSSSTSPYSIPARSWQEATCPLVRRGSGEDRDGFAAGRFELFDDIHAV